MGGQLSQVQAAAAARGPRDDAAPGERRGGAATLRAHRPRAGGLAITAYLTSRGTGVPISPGIVAGQPVFEGRLRALADSVARGERLYASRCRSCHDLGDVTPAALRFPRAVNGQVESLERFLGGHPPGLSPLGWDGQPTADHIVFLISSVGGGPANGSP